MKFQSRAQGHRRAFGQHFLRDHAVTSQIADAAVEHAAKHGCRTLLEIGPGRGAITVPILERLLQTSRSGDIERLIVVEKDRKIFGQLDSLKEIPAGHSLRWEKICDDFITLPEQTWLGHAPIAIVSNLPYSSGTHILTQLARHFEKIPVMVLMFQSEVSKRLRAGPSDSHRGSLSVWIQNRWDVETLVHVKPRSFSPPPKVDSEVVILTARATPHVEIAPGPLGEKQWDSFLKTCFAHRRKMLRSSIPWQNALEVSGVDGKKRPEALHWNEWNQLFAVVKLGASD